MGGLRPNTHPTSTCSFFGKAWILIAVRAESHFQCIGVEIPQGNKHTLNQQWHSRKHRGTAVQPFSTLSSWSHDKNSRTINRPPESKLKPNMWSPRCYEVHPHFPAISRTHDLQSSFHPRLRKILSHRLSVVSLSCQALTSCISTNGWMVGQLIAWWLWGCIQNSRPPDNDK